MGNPIDNSDRNPTVRSEITIVFYRILSEFWAGYRLVEMTLGESWAKLICFLRSLIGMKKLTKAQVYSSASINKVAHACVSELTVHSSIDLTRNSFTISDAKVLLCFDKSAPVMISFMENASFSAGCLLF